MNIRSILRTFGGFVAALAMPLILASSFVRAQSTDSAEISRLLKVAEEHAALVADDAATLDSYTHSSIAWQTHGQKLSEMADHVNALGRVNKELNDLSPQGSPWQQKAISQIDSLLRDMADQLTATIDHLNKNQSRVHMPPFQNYVHASHELASKTAQMISDFVDYDQAASRANDLERKLELPKAGPSE